jgi:hypothetical protein
MGTPARRSEFPFARAADTGAGDILVFAAGGKYTSHLRSVYKLIYQGDDMLGEEVLVAKEV